MHPDLTERILLHLESVDKVDTLDLATQFNVDHQKVVGALKSIQAHGDLVNAETVTHKTLGLTDEGQSVVEKGSHEATVYGLVPAEGIPQAVLMVNGGPNAKVGFSKAMSHGWILVDKSVQPPLIKRKVDQIVDTVREQLVLVASGKSQLSAKDVADFKKRKLLQETTTKSFVLSKGPEFSTTLTKLETDLTVDMLTSGLWEQLKFKSYNFDALGATPTRGHLHPLLKMRSEFRQIFLEMGFSEMPTNNYVESSFWNFDALFQPQQHPARDAHDTFFINHPAQSYKFPHEYLQRVKAIHSKGGYGSLGYGYNWKLDEAQKNLLRTHTTAVSARMLFKLANQPGGFTPAKYFSIDKVFRNETLDATHLAEFHQVEGVIADVGLTLGDLIGTLYEFFRKLGITQLEFKPAYNPYTEPSMEIFCYHPGLRRWIEVGNSGIFRPEMLLPMGLPENVNVIAWGLSLERPTMIMYGINNIRDLVGPKVDLKMVEDGPICRLDYI
ncbi:phenylalanine--tRNA ligase alpha subunit [Drosophila grimshawi]|uniref:phenylalanine--tRNA ligase n=1 Tax=Drosophila grimshawi TaxID=7222 RepID=B4JNQ5_DROGR|nr:phenylalanine--tRNA ligase alpha subunit [Drosophila grimshawi]EDV92348.1 GH24862 [Drosophila grimshawi]